ncbi:hypothetical protein J1614_007789 [Plenodomus biglobosus]|nr:hypothetical protein J1614_007789 [Plenodomus biglobosus]
MQLAQLYLSGIAWDIVGQRTGTVATKYQKHSVKVSRLTQQTDGMHEISCKGWSNKQTRTEADAVELGHWCARDALVAMDAFFDLSPLNVKCSRGVFAGHRDTITLTKLVGAPPSQGRTRLQTKRRQLGELALSTDGASAGVKLTSIV